MRSICGVEMNCTIEVDASAPPEGQVGQVKVIGAFDTILLPSVKRTSFGLAPGIEIKLQLEDTVI